MITWFFGSRSDKIAKYNRSRSDTVIYYGRFCNGGDRCYNSSKGELHPSTGSLTIYSVEVSDEDFYFYSFAPNDTGDDYEIYMEVHG